jgi:N-acetylmuramoyl-L-alanine amidase
MRSFVSALIIALLLATPRPGATEAPSPRAIYTDALAKERTLRRALDISSSEAAPASLLRRIRVLVEAYERMAKDHPTSAYMDNALWQGALLAADAYWTFGETSDKDAALRMFSMLTARFPTSSLVKQVAPQVKRLKEARPAPRAPQQAVQPRPTPSTPRATAVAARPAAATTPTQGVVSLLSVRRDVLPEVLRITLELAQEVPFRSDRIPGPARVFIDLENTRAVEAIKDATIPFEDDVVRQVRIGRQADARTRVVFDLSGAGRHTVYTLYNPFRIVVDVERVSGAPGAPQPASAPGRQPTVVAAAAPDAARPPVAAAVVATTAGPGRPSDVTAALNSSPAAARPSPAASPVTAPSPRVGPSPLPPAVDAAPAGTEDIPASIETPAPPVSAAPAPPVAPRVNGGGGFSLSRQLGLGVSRIVVDPGHGGHDPGAKTTGLTEADLVLDVALRLEQLLLKHDGFEVVLTRRVDAFVPLEERTAIANREGADLFLSIHANASRNRAARGVETYFLNLTANPDAEEVAARENAASARSMSQLPDIVKAIALNNKIQESRDFASMIQSALAAQIQKTDGSVRNLGVKQAPFMVLLGATMPSVLAEISFITNRQDAALLKTEAHRQKIAEALYAGVLRYRQSLKVGPALAEQ